MEGINPITVSPAMEQVKQSQLKQFNQMAGNLKKATKTSITEKNDVKLKSACEQFEAMFLDLMYKEMRKTVPKDSLFGDSNADNILRSMQETEMTKNLAHAGGVGLADMLYRQISKQNIKQPAAVAAKSYK